MPPRRLTDQRMILTGASSGIGRRLAVRLGRAGAKLIVNARRELPVRQLAEEIVAAGGECHFVIGDITDPAVREAVVRSAIDHTGGIDVLINNAGIGALGSFTTASPERLKQVFEVNFFAAAEMIRLALPRLKAGRDPLIVNVGSVLGHRAVPLKSEYCASKFALHGFSDALRAELAGDGVRVLLISPSTTRGEFFRAAIEDSSGISWESDTAMEPDYVARKIVSAMRGRQHELILPLSGRLLVWLDRLLPTMADRLVTKFGQ